MLLPTVMTALTSLPLTSSTYVASATWPVFWASVSACSTWKDKPGFAIRDANAFLAACAASRFGSSVGDGVGTGVGVTTGVMKYFGDPHPTKSSPRTTARAMVGRLELTFQIALRTGAG